MNSNSTATASGTDVAMRMRQALEYKRSKAPGAAAPLPTSSRAVALSAATPSATPAATRPIFSGSSSSVTAQSSPGFNGKLGNLPHNAPLRVRNAMAAAMQYRQDKAERTAAAARAAAALAAAKAAANSVGKPSGVPMNGAVACLEQQPQSVSGTTSAEGIPAASNGASESGPLEEVAESILSGVRGKGNVSEPEQQQHAGGEDSLREAVVTFSPV